MSRIGDLPITLPSAVDFKIVDAVVKVKGPKGELEQKIHPATEVKREGETVVVSPRERTRENKKYHGLMRTLINNMVIGVTEGFSKELVMVGVGYRAKLKGKVLELSLGYSHPIEFQPLAGVTVQVGKQNNLVISGANKEHVGRTAAIIRDFRKPEPYHGKGVRYKDEVIVTKVGKSGAKK